MSEPLLADSVATKARCVLMRRSPLEFLNGAIHRMNKTAYLPEDKDNRIESLSHFKPLHASLYSSLQSTQR